jgi:hypothetical protein
VEKDMEKRLKEIYLTQKGPQQLETISEEEEGEVLGEAAERIE